MLPLLLVLFIVVPIAELYVIIKVGEAIGVLWTIALLFADSIVGSLLMRSQGRAAWRRFRLALAEGRVPGREVFDGALVIFGGALLLSPGFLTDILGALLLIPPTRAAVRSILMRRFAAGLVTSAFGGIAGRGRRGAGRGSVRAPFDPAPPGDPRGREYDVDGTATESDQDRLP